MVGYAGVSARRAEPDGQERRNSVSNLVALFPFWRSVM
jgi:hypothetical protein